MCLKQVRVPLWNCGTDQNQTENAGRKLLLFSDCKYWNRYRKQGNTNIAKADSIIQCVLFDRLFISNLTTTQNLSFPFNYFEPPTPNGKGGGGETAYLGNIFFGSWKFITNYVHINFMRILHSDGLPKDFYLILIPSFLAWLCILYINIFRDKWPRM